MRSVDGDDPKSTARTNPSTKPGDATGGAVFGRLTRSRGSSLAAANTGPTDPAHKGRRGGKRPSVEGTSPQLRKKLKTAGGRTPSKEELKLAARPYQPTFGKPKDWIIRNDAEGKRRTIPVFLSDLPTVTTEVEDAETEESIESLQDSDLVMDKSRSIVAISSLDPDGSVLFQCTGIVYEFDEAIKTAKILTSSLICTHGDELRHPKLKVFVHLSNETKVEARFLFFNDHYQVALLQIVTGHTLVPASFGARPDYEQEMFMLGRDEDYHLIVRSGSILRFERPFLGRIHYLFSSADSPVDCIGGPVIDKHGQVIGMIATRFIEAAIVSISTVMKCITMWDRFGCIVHPVHEMELKAVRMLNIYRRDELSVRHNIRSGFIVYEVLPKSTAHKIGIRRGDVIDVMSLKLGTTVYEFEDNLLELSWQILEKELDRILDLEIQVHNLYDRESVRTVLPMRFSDATVVQHDTLEFEAVKK